MTVYIGLFRGINVGGNKPVKMETLRAALEGAGLAGVKTYIQSGNTVFKSNQTARRIETTIAETFSKTFGFDSRVSVRSMEEWNCMIGKNPYPQVKDNPKSVHAVILDGDPTDEALSELDRLARESERFTLRNRVLYLYTPEGFGTSKLAGALDKVLKVPLTARNWRTVLTLQDMAAAI